MERQAINTIIQGSAADVTKMAMIKVDKIINQGVLNTRVHLVMHLHDELIFDVSIIFTFHIILTILLLSYNCIQLLSY